MKKDSVGGNRLFLTAICLICLSLAALLVLRREPQKKVEEPAADISDVTAPTIAGSPEPIVTEGVTSTSIDPQMKAKVLENYARQPLHFQPNEGQIESDEVRFTTRGSGYQMFFSATKAILVLRQAAAKTNPEKDQRLQPAALKQLPNAKPDNEIYKQAVVEMQIVGANREAPSFGAEELEGKSNYYLGNDPEKWRTNVANYQRVRFEEVYAGIDLEYYGNQRQLEYDFVVEPQADPEQIRLKFEGARKLKVDNQTGELVLTTALGEIRQQKPFVYQLDEEGQRREIASRYKVKAGEVGFSLGEYDKEKKLVIDPVVLAYSTFHGGTSSDIGVGIALDSAGNTYITGNTTSASNFPLLNARQGTISLGVDAFISKLSPTGVLLFSTYHGGSGDDRGEAIAVDSSGNAYITGITTSTTNFPLLNARQSTHGGAIDAFISKFSPTGVLLFSTYHGGNNDDFGTGIAVDAVNVYITGQTASTTNFPILNARQPVKSGSSDAFISKLDPSGVLLYSTFHGGNGFDRAEAVAVDASGNAHITGQTLSSTSFPLLNARQGALAGPSDAFISKLSPTGVLLYSTYHGGNNDDEAFRITVDFAGNAYITGQTNSTTGFPLLNARQGTNGGGVDAYVSKLSPTGVLLYSTYHGGTGTDYSFGIITDSTGSVYITGETSSSTNFPLLNARQSTLLGANDAYISKLSPNGVLLYSTYHGGNGVDSGTEIVVDSFNHAYIIGWTTSGTNFPIFNARQPTFGGGSEDAFISKIENFSAQTYSVTGRVTNGGLPLAGVTLTLSSAALSRTSTSDANGNYLFSEVPPDNYSLSPFLAGSAFTPPNRIVSVTNADVINQDFALAQACAYNLSFTSTNVPAAGDTLFFGIITVDQCRWTGASNVPWIVLLTDPSGTGNGAVQFVVQRNYGVARSGTIIVNGQLLTVNQAAAAPPVGSSPEGGNPCDVNLTVNAANQDRQVVSSAGGNLSSFTVNTGAGCLWTAYVSSVTEFTPPPPPGTPLPPPWITVTGGASGSGTGPVTFSVAPYTTGNSQRRGFIHVNGVVYTVIQTPPVGFAYVLNPTSANHGAAIATGSFGVDVPAQRSWAAYTGDRWVTPISDRGNDDGPVNYSITANTGTLPRTGTIIVGDQPFTIRQAAGQAGSCNYLLSSAGQNFAAASGTGSFTVSAGTGCVWTAARAPTAPWITINGGAGNGSGTVSFTLEANTGAARTGTITVGNRTYTVSQGSPQQTCNYTISPGFQRVEIEGTASNIQVTANPGCAWTAQSNTAWLRILSGASGSGNGPASFIAQTNNTVVERVGTLTIAGQLFTVTQDANPNAFTTPFDFDGDNKTDIAIFRPGPAEWWVNRSSAPTQTIAAQFGATSDRVVPADFTGDGRTDIAVWRPSTGEWFILRSENGSYYSFPFGTSGDLPAPADFDNDGMANPAVFRPSAGLWFIGNADSSATIVQFGVAGDIPVVADYDGDGKADIGIFRGSGAGGAEWWIARSTAGLFSTIFGISTDKPVPADYTGDGKTDVAIWRNASRQWFILRSEDLSFYSFPFGSTGDTPVPGDYDGDGIADVAVFNNTTATWWIQRSTAGLQVTSFGAVGDRPIPSVFIP